MNIQLKDANKYVELMAAAGLDLQYGNRPLFQAFKEGRVIRELEVIRSGEPTDSYNSYRPYVLADILGWYLDQNEKAVMLGYSKVEEKVYELRINTYYFQENEDVTSELDTIRALRADSPETKQKAIDWFLEHKGVNSGPYTARI